MTTELRNSKRPRDSGRDPDTVLIQDENMDNVDGEADSDLPTPPSYASKAMNLPKPRDVRVDKKKNVEERAMIKITNPTAEIPFKQVDFDQELKDLMIHPWKSTIIIKVLGKPWYYPTLLLKLESMWNLQGNFFELMDLGHNCYCLKGLTEEKRTMILT